MGKVKLIIWVNPIDKALNFRVPQSYIKKNACV